MLGRFARARTAGSSLSISFRALACRALTSARAKCLFGLAILRGRLLELSLRLARFGGGDELRRLPHRVGRERCGVALGRLLGDDLHRRLGLLRGAARLRSPACAAAAPKAWSAFR